MTSFVISQFNRIRFYFLVAFLLTFTVVIVTSVEPEVTWTEVVERTKQEKIDSRMQDEMRGGKENKALVKATAKIAVVESNSFLMRQLTPSGDIYTGYLADLVREISKMSSFRFEWFVVDTEITSDRKRNQTHKWAELAEKLTTEKVNISVLRLNSVHHHHSQRFSYTRPLLHSTLSLLLKTPTSTQNPTPFLLEDVLANRNRPRFGVTDELVAHHLKASNSTLYRQLWGGKAPSEVVLTQEEGLRKVREGDFILLMESTDAAYLSSTEPCDLISSVQATHETRYVFAALENSSLLPELDRALVDLGAVDFFGELFRKWWDRDDCTFRVEQREIENIDHDEMERIFFTSPIKFFKSKSFNHDSSSTSASYQLQGTVTTKRHSDPGGATLASQTTRADYSNGVYAVNPTPSSKAIKESNRKRRRTTSAYPTSTTRTHNRSRFTYGASSSLRHLATEQTTKETPKRLQSENYETIHPVLETIPPGDDLGHGQREIDGIESGHRVEDTPSDERAAGIQKTENNSNDRPTRPPTTVKSRFRTSNVSRHFVKDYDWVFYTNEPRFSQEIIYDIEEEFDENTEQKAAFAALDSAAKTEDEAVVTVRNTLEGSSSSASRTETTIALAAVKTFNILAISQIIHFSIAS